jgi:hypothetical protein
VSPPEKIGKQAPISFGDASEDDLRRELVRLRANFIQTGALQELQATQLRCWPFRIDPRIDNTGVTAHIVTMDKRVDYVWVAKTVPASWQPTDEYRRRLGFLTSWVKFLLGDDYTVTFNLNGNNLSLRGRKTGDRRVGHKKPRRAKPARRR